MIFTPILEQEDHSEYQQIKTKPSEFSSEYVKYISWVGSAPK